MMSQINHYYVCIQYFRTKSVNVINDNDMLFTRAFTIKLLICNLIGRMIYVGLLNCLTCGGA